jgi:hypothetical protein
LLAHDPFTQNHHWGKTRVDEDANGELNQKAHYEHTGRLKVPGEPSVHETDHGQEEQYACSGTDRTFV